MDENADSGPGAFAAELDGQLGRAVQGILAEPSPTDVRERLVDGAASWTPNITAQRPSRRMRLLAGAAIALTLLVVVSVAVHLVAVNSRTSNIAQSEGTRIDQGHQPDLHSTDSPSSAVRRQAASDNVDVPMPDRAASWGYSTEPPRKHDKTEPLFPLDDEPIQKMIGRPAIKLPATGWVGKRPHLEGRPHLIHFWATWRGPCRRDFQHLRALAESHQIVGIHPAGTPAEDIERVIAEERLCYPTLVAEEDERETLAGYPVKVFPYCILVDRHGRVADHGPLGPELVTKLRTLVD
jgi:thiol-disulfide isomerase/thioredoxin